MLSTVPDTSSLEQASLCEGSLVESVENQMQTVSALMDQVNKTEPNQDDAPEQDDAIEGYMRDLFERIQQGNGESKNIAGADEHDAPAVLKSQGKVHASLDLGSTVETHDEFSGPSLTSSEGLYESIADAEAAFVAKSIARRRFIETEADIMELRALANDVSRRVIAIHNRRRKKEHFWNKVFISIVALIAGIVLLVLSGLGGTVVLSGAYVALIIAIVFGHDAIGLAKRFFYARRAGDRPRR